MARGKNSMKKVVIVGQLGLADDRAAAILTRNISKSLQMTGFSVQLVDLIICCQSKRLTENEIAINVRRKKIKTAFYNRPLCEDIVRAIGSCDVVCPYNLLADVSWPLMEWARSNDITYCPIITEWYNVSQVKGIVSKIVRKICIETGMRFVNARADGVIVCSPLLKRYYERKLNKISMLPTVCKSANVRIADLRRRGDCEGRLFVFCGCLDPRKEDLGHFFDLLDRAAKKAHQTYSVRIVGATLESYQAMYGELPDGARGKVLFFGRCSNEECKREIFNADYSIIYRASNKKTNAGFPTKFGESIACGTPVLATSTSSISEYLVEGKNGFLLPFDDDLAIEKLGKILTLSEEEIAEQKKYCRNHPLFSIEWASQVLGSFFADLLQGD